MDWFILALISAGLSAAAAIFEKKTLFKEKALRFSTVLGISSLIFSLPFFFMIDYSKLTMLPLGVLFFKSILGAASYLCIMKGIRDLEISEALPLLVLTPGFVAILAFIILGDVLTLVQIGGMLLLLAGTYALQVDSTNLLNPFKRFKESKGHRYILWALALQVITSILDKLLLGKYNVAPNAFMAFQQLFLAIVFLIIALFISKKNRDTRTISATIRESWWLFALVSIFTVGYRYTQIAATKLGPVALVLAVKRISVFFAVLIGGKMFSEHHLLRRAAATAIMLVGAYLVVM